MGNHQFSTVESVYTSGIISIGRLGHINLDIAMPEFSNVQIKGDAGTIHVEGIHGQVQVKTNAGTIHVQQTILEGQSSLTTNAGTIQFYRLTRRSSWQRQPI